MIALISHITGQGPIPVHVEVTQSTFPWQAIIGFVGVLVGAAITFAFNLNLEKKRQAQERDRNVAEYKALFQLFVLEAVYIMERCVQYIAQAIDLEKEINEVRGTARDTGFRRHGISKSIICRQLGSQQLERLQVLGADWRIAESIYNVNEIAGQVQRQLDKIPPKYIGDPADQMIAENYFVGIAAFVSEEIFQNSLLPSIHELLEAAKTVCPHEFVKKEENRVAEFKRKHDKVRPPQPA